MSSIPSKENVTYLYRKTALRFTINIYVFAVFFASFFAKKKKLPDTLFYSLTYDQAFRNSSPKELEEFLQDLEKKRIIKYIGDYAIQVRSLKWKRLFKKRFVFDIETYIAIKCIKRKYSFAVIKYLRKTIKFDKNLSFVRNLMYWKKTNFDRMIWNMQETQLVSLTSMLTVQTQGLELPYIFQCSSSQYITRIMIWYSNNSYPILRKCSTDIQPDILTSNVEMDLNLVWDRKQEEFVQKQGFGKSRIFGPITLQSNMISEIKDLDSNLYYFSYFDVTPMENPPDTIYTFDFALKNLKAAMELKSSLEGSLGIKIDFVLKPKRAYLRNHHNMDYVDILYALNSKGEIKLLPPETRLFSLISMSCFVVGVPFTSPVQIGKYLSRQSVYLAFGSDEWNIPSKFNSIPVIRSSMDLKKYVKTQHPSSYIRIK